ncbi:MAG: hypothetical protein KatS3mg123_0839 [Burkholderiales bacterium]|jgi:hypothetical protein|nr:MAG: hypothetical protein KatS3mg123_0839 [Burkholderiales bacterium]
MFQPSRDQARQFLFEAWRKYRERQVLSPLEDLAVAVILLHPEYHPVLEDPERYGDMEYFPEAGEVNPFLHLGLHLAVEEQLSIDQPPGLVDRVKALERESGSRHEALHATMECLGETLWRAQRDGTAPDAGVYLDCLDRRLGK